MSQKETRVQKRTRMFNLIDSYNSSSQTQKDFCLDNDIKYHAFQFWLRQYRLSKDSDNVHEVLLAENGFLPIESSPPADRTILSQYGFVIEYPNGVRLLMDTDPNIQLIRELLKLEAV